MIWFSNPGGRTGNQLFQYAFLESIRRPGEMVFTTKLAKFLGQFHPTPGYHSFEFHWLVRTIDRFLDPLVYQLLVKTRVVSFWDDRWTDAGHSVRLTKGWFPSLIYVRGYYQLASLVDQNTGKFRSLLRQETVRKAREFLAKVPQGRIPAYLHLRRGDYLRWKVMGHWNVALPLEYYREAVDRIRTRCSDVYFVIVSDDPEYARKNFGWLGDHLVSTQSPLVDLAVMSLCRYGVLSNSTLAWWGGYLMDKRELVLAPEQWLGFKADQEYPGGIIPPWAEVIPRDLWYAPAKEGS